MKRAVVLLALVACADKRGGRSCGDRVAAVKANLTAPRPLEEIQRVASPALRRALADAETTPAANRATAFAEQLEPMIAGCDALLEVFGAIGGDVQIRKDLYLRDNVPIALEECECRASPEDVGGLVEAILDAWRR